MSRKNRKKKTKKMMIAQDLAMWLLGAEDKSALTLEKLLAARRKLLSGEYLRA